VNRQQLEEGSLHFLTTFNANNKLATDFNNKENGGTYDYEN